MKCYVNSVNRLGCKDNDIITKPYNYEAIFSYSGTITAILFIWAV